MNKKLKPTYLTTSLLFTLAVILLSFTLNAQTIKPKKARVETTIYGIQTGVLGLWVQNESRLSNSIALRAELGLDTQLFGGSIYHDDDRINYVLTPVITLEPRWYYNLKKRVEKGRKIAQNNGNFIGLELSFNPDWFLISNVSDVTMYNQIRIIPKWGIRRTIGDHFTYEAGIGFGYHYTFSEPHYYFYSPEDKSEFILELHLRIGYTF